MTVLLTGSFTAREKAQLKKLVAEGLVHVAVGTHALLEEGRGVQEARPRHHRRAASLRRAAAAGPGAEGRCIPDVLVMTATPIPRTLAMTLYGDLDVSVIDETAARAASRSSPSTTPPTSIEQVYSFMKKQIDEGRQAYVVYPVIEESETQAMKAAQKMYEHLSHEVFPDIAVGLMHGRLRRRRKGSGDAALQGRARSRSWSRPR